jgi:hypothetical protein
MSASDVHAERFRLPLPVRLANGVGRLFTWARPMRLDPDEIIDDAMAETGLEDLGEVDVRTAVRELTTGLQESGALSPLGRSGMRDEALEGAKVALRVREAMKSDAALASTSIARPVIIVSAPRTGTTLLHNLLSLHPAARAPRLWELRRPCPAPGPSTPENDPRIVDARSRYEQFDRRLPEFNAIHEMNADKPDECQHLFRHVSMCRGTYASVAPIPGYQAWINQADMRPAYRFYADCLRLLVHHYPQQRLVLKNPPHSLALRELLEVIPDACIVQIHRDPRASAASFCSLTEAARSLMCTRTDLEDVGRAWTDVWSKGLEQMPAIRAGLPDERFFDVDYDSLVSDPVAMVRRIFERFDFDEPDASADHVREYLAERPAGHRGRHRYSLERYGLDEAAVCAPLGDYMQRFGL